MTAPTEPQPDVDLSTLSRVELELRLTEALTRLRSLDEQGHIPRLRDPIRFYPITIMAASGIGSDGVKRSMELAFGRTSDGARHATNLLTIRSRWPEETSDRVTQVALSTLGVTLLQAVVSAPIFTADPEPKEVLVSALKHSPRHKDDSNGIEETDSDH